MVAKQVSCIAGIAASSLIGGWSVCSLQAQVADGAAAGQGNLQEIVVTAQRRGENLQNVPIAVTAVSAKDIAAQGGQTSTDLSLVAPSVVVNVGAGGGGVNIRGVGGTGASGDEPANAIYIDGVYQASPSAIVFQLNNIERLEVLKGPQGTLFGRNASGGVIQVLTLDPSRTARADVSAGYASYDRVNGNFYVTGPITSDIAANLSGYGYNQAKGWGTNVATGDDYHKGHGFGFRGKLKWVGDRSDFILSGFHAEDHPAENIAPIILGLRNSLGQPAAGFYDINLDTDNPKKTTQTTVSGTLHHDLGFAKLLSITAYDHATLKGATDADGTARPVVIGTLGLDVNTFTQELQLQSPDSSKVTWLAGLFYMNSLRPGDTLEVTGLSQVALGGFSDTLSRELTKSYSAFGQTTVPITSTTSITAGLRFTEDDRSIQAWTFNAAAPGHVPIANASVTDKKVTWRLSLNQKLGANTLVYVSDSRGFKSGLFNNTTPGAPSVAPQTIDAYEAGLKTETSDRRLRFSLSAYYYDFQNLQVIAVNPTSTGTLFLNAGRAHYYGLDADFAAVPMRGLTLKASLALLDAHFVSDPSENRNIPCYSVPAAPAGGLVLTPGGCSAVGNRVPNAPKAVVNVSADYGFDTEIGRLDATGALNYNSGYFFDPSNFPYAHQGAYPLLKLTFGWTSKSRAYDVRLWADNLLNKQILTGIQLSPIGGFSSPHAPRTFGVTAGAHF